MREGKRNSRFLLMTEFLQPNGLNGDKASSVNRLKGMSEFIHGRFGDVVKRLGRTTSTYHEHGSLVDSTTNLTVDGILRGRDGRRKEFSFGREVQTVI